MAAGRQPYQALENPGTVPIECGALEAAATEALAS